MNWLVLTALRFRVLVVAAAIALMVVGIRTANDVPLDVFPEFAPPRVEIQTEAPGLSTEEVDSLVTVPIENSLNGIPFLDHVRSKSVLSETHSQMDMTVLCKWTIRPRLMAVPGVAWRCQRRDLGRLRSAIPSSGGSRSTTGQQHHLGHCDDVRF